MLFEASRGCLGRTVPVMLPFHPDHMYVTRGQNYHLVDFNGPQMIKSSIKVSRFSPIFVNLTELFSILRKIHKPHTVHLRQVQTKYSVHPWTMVSIYVLILVPSGIRVCLQKIQIRVLLFQRAISLELFVRFE